MSVRDQVRQLFGFRRLRESAGYRLPQAPGEPIPEEELHAFRRARPYLLAVLCFAATTWLAVWLYGLFARGLTPDEAAGRGNLVLASGEALERGDVPGARRLYEQAREQDPKAPALFLLEGHLIAVQGGQAAQALAERTADLTQGRRALEEVLRAAGLRQEKGDVEGCLQALRQAAQIRPRNPDVRYLLASSLLLTGRYADVIPEADELERLGGGAVAACQMRGQAYLALEQPRAAKREFQAAMGYGAASPELRVSYADTLNSLGMHQQALGQLAIARHQDPENANLYFSLGMAAWAMGDVSRAEAAYRAALRRDPKHVKALNNLAYLLAESRGKPAEALPLAQRAADLAPDAATVLDTLARVHQLLGQDAEALPLLEKAGRIDPGDAHTQLHLALAYHRADRNAEAGPILRDLIATTSDGQVRSAAADLLNKLR